MFADSGQISIELNQKVTQQIFGKAKFIENDGTRLKENILETPQQRIDLIFLDSIIAYELKSENLPRNYKFCIYQGRQKPVVFPLKTKNYDATMAFDSIGKVSLFPNNTFSEPLYLQIQFPQRGRYILKEMTLSIAGSLIVVVLVFIDFCFYV